jgi:hypothetical protein
MDASVTSCTTLLSNLLPVAVAGACAGVELVAELGVPTPKYSDPLSFMMP